MSAVVEAFALRAAVQALMDGDAQVSEDRREIRWHEPICDPFMDRLVGVEFDIEQQAWVPLVEAGIPKDSATIEDENGETVGFVLPQDLPE